MLWLTFNSFVKDSLSDGGICHNVVEPIVAELSTRLHEARQIEQARDEIIEKIEGIADCLRDNAFVRKLSPKEENDESHGVAMKKLETFESKLVILKAKVTSLEKDLSHSRQKNADLSEKHLLLTKEKETLGTKHIRLQEYVRKLTKKCDQWELFHNREIKTLQYLKDTNTRLMQQVPELAVVHCKNSPMVRGK